MGDAAFVPGLHLSKSFYEEVVRARADQVLGAERYAAALIGPGSEVLGLDSEISADHDWGPRVVLVVSSADVLRAESVREGLPESFQGRSLAFGRSLGRKPWTQPIYAITLEQLFEMWVGFNPLRGVSLIDWLSAPANGLLMLTSGTVFHDGPGELTTARQALRWYPDELWIWMMGCQWKRISQEHSFVGRAAQAGDDLGGRLLAARLARDAIRLGFLIERRYAPYSKWLAKATGWLECGQELSGHLDAALSTSDAWSRQTSLAEAYRVLGEATNALWPGLEIDCSHRDYHDRGYVVGPAGPFASHLLDHVSDPELRRLPHIGAVDQVIDSTDADWRVAGLIYEGLLAAEPRSEDSVDPNEGRRA